VVFPEVHLEGIVVDKVLLFSASPFSTIANVAALVLVSAMSVELIVTVETLSAEPTFWVSLEATLIYCSGVIVAELLMLSQIGLCEEFVLVGEDLLVSRA
jgi:hypothetical protein